MAGRARDYSFEARFDRAVRSQGIAAIPIVLLEFQGTLRISPGEMWLLTVLLSYRWTASAPYPSVHRIAEQGGVTRPTIHAYLNSLEAKGLIDIEPRVDVDGRRTTSVYHLEPLFERLASLVEASQSPGGQAKYFTGESQPADWGESAGRLPRVSRLTGESQPADSMEIDPKDPNSEELDPDEQDLSLTWQEKNPPPKAEREKNQNLSRTTESPPTPLPAQAPPPIADPLTAAIAALYHTPDHPATPSMLSIYRGIAAELRDGGVKPEQVKPYHDLILATHTEWSTVQPAQLAKQQHLLVQLGRAPRGSPPEYTGPTPESYGPLWRPPNAAPVPVPPQPDEEQHGPPVAPERAEELLAGLRAMVGRLRVDDREPILRVDDREPIPRVVDRAGVSVLAPPELREEIRERNRRALLADAHRLMAEAPAPNAAPRLQEVPR